MATLHGLAHLVVEEKAAGFFSNATSETFLKQDVPKVLARMYPDRAVKISENRQSSTKRRRISKSSPRSAK